MACRHLARCSLGLAALAAILLGGIAPALAHTGVGVAGGLASGFSHPLLGADHLVAMVAVGLWSAFLGTRAVWLLPVLFPVLMAAGAGLGMLGVPLPAVETGIAASAVVLGALVALSVRLPLLAAAAIVALFAVFHGHAHGTELPAAASPLAYALGFMAATALLHLLGIGLGRLLRWPGGQVAVRAGGTAIAIVGLVFLVG